LLQPAVLFFCFANGLLAGFKVSREIA